MGELYVVSIEVETLRRRFEERERRPVTTDAVLNLLRACGFRSHGDEWLCEKMSLGVLDDDEYRIVRPHGRSSSQEARPG